MTTFHMDKLMVPSHLAVALSFLAIISVHCLDKNYQYQDAHPSNKKLPLERLDESRIYLRHKRDADPSKNITIDDHRYYTSVYSSNKISDWFELSDHPERKIERYLSKGYLRSRNYKLQFTFPYYGHPITNTTITTGGFMYVGYVVTSLITSVMYIAPFMAPFNPSLNESGVIYYFSNATQFTVQWTNLHLFNNEKAGPFTFQCTLYKDGRILFAYKSIPLSPLEVLHNNKVKKHPVRVGISDAFYGYRIYFEGDRWIKVRIFYVYHKVNKTSQIISNGSTLLLNPVKNCITAKSCGECVNMTKTSVVFKKCSWCSKLKRCSDSFDRHRVEWFQTSCHKTAIKEYQSCQAESASKQITYASETKSGIGKGAIAAIVVVCLVLVVIVGVLAWCFYAYTHPITPSGLFLIELRNKPAQLFKSGATVDGMTSSASRA